MARALLSLLPPVVLPLLLVSSDELVRALQRAGFTVVKRTTEACVLTLACRDVVVPHGAVDDEHLRELLRTAGVLYSDFLFFLERTAPTLHSREH